MAEQRYVGTDDVAEVKRNEGDEGDNSQSTPPKLALLFSVGNEIVREVQFSKTSPDRATVTITKENGQLMPYVMDIDTTHVRTIIRQMCRSSTSADEAYIALVNPDDTCDVDERTIMSTILAAPYKYKDGIELHTATMEDYVNIFTDAYIATSPNR